MGDLFFFARQKEAVSKIKYILIQLSPYICQFTNLKSKNLNNLFA